MAQAVYLPEIPSKIVKWKVSHGSHVGQGTVLCLYEPVGTSKQLRLRCSEVGTVRELTAKEGDVITAREAVLMLGGCTHPTVMKDMCAECGADLRQESGTPGQRKDSSEASVAMVHSIPELIVSHKEAIELGKADEEHLLTHRKLVLLVDLDQTLIHTTNDNIPANLKDVYHFQLWHGRNLLWYHTKFRPGTQKFLENISKLYELHICTFGVRMYAHTIAKMMDPKGKFFSHRILSRDECFNATSKTANLKALFPCGDSMVCIIDDREDVWSFSPSLVHVKPYLFFDGTADINAPKGLEGETWEGEGSEESDKGPNPRPKSRRARIVRVPRKTPPKENPRDPRARKTSTENNTSEGKKEHDEEKQRSTQTGDAEEARRDDGELKESPDEKSEDKPLGAASVQESADSTLMENRDSASAGEATKEGKDGESADVALKERKDEENTDGALKEKEDGESADGALKGKEDGQSADGALKGKEDGENADDALKESEDGESADGALKEGKVEKSGSAEGKEISDKAKDSELREILADKSDSVEVGQKEGNGNSYIALELNAEAGKTDNSKEKNLKSMDSKPVGGSENVEYDEEIEWEDNDDYLMYLEDILKRIHTAYFQFYDQMKEKSGESSIQLPDIKNVLPYVKKKVLRGVNILFSGMIPINKAPDKSRAYIVAKNLGANIHTSLEKGPDDATTHVIAARDGTEKVREARRTKGIHVVNADWLWECAYRWEHVDERLFHKLPPPDADPQNRDSPVNFRPKKIHKRLPPNKQAAEGEGDKVPTEAKFSDSYNPLYRMSQDDIDSMGREVDEISDSSSSDSDEREDLIRRKVLNFGKELMESSSEESMSADHPKGWGKKRKRSDVEDEGEEEREEGEEDKTEDEQDMEKRHRMFACEDDSGSESTQDQSSVSSVDEEMAAAVERKFLGLL